LIFGVSVPEEMSREELIAVLARRDGQITAQAARIAALVEANEQLAARLARLEHLLSRNSGNSSSAPSKDDDPGRTPPAVKKRRGGPTRGKGKQPGAPGTNLAWADRPDDQQDRFPRGHCGCGDDLVNIQAWL
jgi:transposase